MTVVPTPPVDVFKVTLLTLEIAASASPLNPNVSIWYKSSSSFILLVACLENA